MPLLAFGYCNDTATQKYPIICNYDFGLNICPGLVRFETGAVDHKLIRSRDFAHIPFF
jgi:hypothetical protein